MPQPPGRPRGFNLELAREVCARIASGMTIRQACEPKHLPARTTFYNWITQAERGDSQWSDLWDIFRRARQASAHAMLDEIVDSARGATSGNAHAVRVLCDNLKWVASKLHPAVYGDYQRVELAGGVRLESVKDAAPEWMRQALGVPTAAPALAAPPLPAPLAQLAQVEPKS